MRIEEFNRRWDEVRLALDAVAGPGERLNGALEALHAEQTEQGFIRDDLGELDRYVFRNPANPAEFFNVQFNPARARRFAGAGLTEPPPGFSSLNDGCFLCVENIHWQHAGKEIGYDVDVHGRHYVAFMNPYPLLPVHTVIAAREHIPQAWATDGAGGAAIGLDTVVGDLIRLSARLPGWIGFYNGVGAGASIRGHFHYQFMPRPERCPRFPLELAAATPHGRPVVTSAYPMHFAHWRGSPHALSGQAIPWIEDWAMGAPTLTANIICVADADTDAIDLYFVARDPSRAPSPLMSGLIGGIEVLGELIFSTEEDRERLEAGTIDFAAVERILAHENVPL